MEEREESEKEPEDTEEEKKEKRLKEDKELHWILGVLVGLIVVFFAAYFIFQSFQSFEYEGMTFTKDRIGDIPLFRYSYALTPEITGGAITEPVSVFLYLRTDPRKNEIPVEGEIIFQRGTVYVTVNVTGIGQCEYSRVGMANLGSFLTSNALFVQGAVPDQIEAFENNLKHVTCETNPKDVVILIQKGQESRITKNNKCYTINIANCEELLPAIEKFEVQSLIDARARFFGDDS